MYLRSLREASGLTQKRAAEICGMPLRTYVRYENESAKGNSLKYEFLVQKLTEYTYIDEEHGLLSLEQVIEKCREVFCLYEVKYAYLFGSYAKGTAGEKSDVDLIVSTDLAGLKFYGFVERLRENLRKNVDVLDLRQLAENAELIDEVLHYGIKIYEQ